MSNFIIIMPTQDAKENGKALQKLLWDFADCRSASMQNLIFIGGEDCNADKIAESLEPLSKQPAIFELGFDYANLDNDLVDFLFGGVSFLNGIPYIEGKSILAGLEPPSRTAETKPHATGDNVVPLNRPRS